MGCIGSKGEDAVKATSGGQVLNPVAGGGAAEEAGGNRRTKDFKRPVWKSDEPMTLEDIKVGD